ncbi:PD-(D/E)XK motif protein [Larkinella rosea]|nr:PD-(D/E)XK motif protein [Larkinella rosea]
MDAAMLAQKWDMLRAINRDFLNTLRIDADIVPDLYVGISAEGKRCLVLKLPDNYTPDFRSVVKQNLSLELYKETGWVILALLDDSYADLFDDLIVSVCSKIGQIPSTADSVAELLKVFYKWSNFFHDPQTEDLSEETVRGLLGELLVLKQFLTVADFSQVNDILHSWRGPYGSRHDFTGERRGYEVKTPTSNSETVKISSEFQLQPEPEKELELVVVTVVPDQQSGISIQEAGVSIQKLVRARSGDCSIFFDALSAKGLTLHSLQRYDMFRYVPVRIVFYACTAENFPSLITSRLPASITAVSYRISIDSLTPFINREENF